MGNQRVILAVDADRTVLEILDKEGFEAVVGNVGFFMPSREETHTTSAASVVLFDKNTNVLWKAP